MQSHIPIHVKKKCVEMYANGMTCREIYDSYFTEQFNIPQSYHSFRTSLYHWRKNTYPDETTLMSGTYDGFTAHNATVQVSANGEIVQAWIKQSVNGVDPEEFLAAIRECVEPYDYKPSELDKPTGMLEIPLFDMHWGIAFLDHYEPVLNELLQLIYSKSWDRIVIPFGQDFFHNDSIVNGHTTKGTVIEKVDMERAVREGRIFMYKIIDAALECANSVKVLYSPGNHDRSISWMFVQVLHERYGSLVVDDAMENRKVISYGKNVIMVTHGDSKIATAKTLAHIFPIKFAEAFANANIREVHCGHLHREGEADIHGVMVRRLSTGAITDDWSDREDFVGTHKRFMVFEWDLDKLKSIHYI